MEILVSMGTKIKAKMVLADLTQTDMADKLNMSLNAFTLKLNKAGNRNFTVGEAQQIKDILNISNEEAGHIFFN